MSSSKLSYKHTSKPPTSSSRTTAKDKPSAAAAAAVAANGALTTAIPTPALAPSSTLDTASFAPFHINSIIALDKPPTDSEKEDIMARIDDAFSEQPYLRKSINIAIELSPGYEQLFGAIASYVDHLRKLKYPARVDQVFHVDDNLQPKTKRVKVGHSNADHVYPQLPPDILSPDSRLHLCPRDSATHIVKGVSFLLPQRKKFDLELSPEGIRARLNASGELETWVKWRDVEHALCLPVPDRPTLTYNFCIIPRHGDGVLKVPVGTPKAELIMWSASKAAPELSLGASDSLNMSLAKDLFHSLLNTFLLPFKKSVIEPSQSDFASAKERLSRKTEKIYSVPCHKGSKEGLLYFLSTGILWGFRKPLLFFSFNSISTVAFTAILSRTLNLAITTHITADETASPTSETHEFAMLDIAEHEPVARYLALYHLSDASMAASRRHADAGPNARSGRHYDAVRDETVGYDEEEEEEEEEGEDYDPGSEGLSEGSGSSDEDEDEDDAREEGGEEEEEEEGEGNILEELGAETAPVVPGKRKRAG
ncbi:MAG: hypothetical protein M1829_002880 [Trizodia sp. TS-e1964]|nr:MAG: hypothetical protein M1829_002880 [Trizodia sp. TS-e1964]